MYYIAYTHDNDPVQNNTTTITLPYISLMLSCTVVTIYDGAAVMDHAGALVSVLAATSSESVATEQKDCGCFVFDSAVGAVLETGRVAAAISKSVLGCEQSSSPSMCALVHRATPMVDGLTS